MPTHYIIACMGLVCLGTSALLWLLKSVLPRPTEQEYQRHHLWVPVSVGILIAGILCFILAFVLAVINKPDPYTLSV